MQLPSNKTVLVLLALIVTVSGCADNSNSSSVTVSQTEGVSITSFSAVPSEVFEEQPVNLELQLKNNGGSRANNVVAQLYNVPFKSDGGDRAWEITSGSKEISFDSLRAPDPETDAPSNEIPRTWTVTAPDLQQGVSIPYTFHTRVFYTYNTTATTDVQVMSSQRYREQGASRSQPEVDNSGGPVQLDVQTRTPIVFFSDGERTSELCVTVENAGKGTPFLPSAYNGGTDYSLSDGNTDKVEVSIEASGTVSVREGSSAREVSIIGGQGVNCFTLDFGSFSGQQIQQTIPITVKANYGYYKESSTSVTVNGRQGGSEDNNDGGTQDGGDDTQDGSETDVGYEWTGPTSNGAPSGTLWDSAEGSGVTEKCNWLYSNTDGNPWTSDDVDGVCEEQ